MALLFFATSPVFAKKDKDKDKDGEQGSRNLRIVAAEPDLEAGTILITGFNFSTGSSFDGVVELFFPSDAEEGPAELTVISFDPDVPQIIFAGPLPGGIEDFPGTYVLQVRREDGSGDKAKAKIKTGIRPAVPMTLM